MGTGRKVVIALVVLASLAGAAVAVRTATQADAQVTVTAAAVDARPADPLLEGDWPTTTTTLAGLDPATGIGVSGPIGPPWPDEFEVALAPVPEVPIFQAPGVPVPTGRTLPHPTVEGFRLFLLVRERQDDWLKVQLNTRPNGATAWIRASDVTVSTVPNHVLIERGAKRLTVFHGDEELFSTSVAPGRSSTPTPLGQFYVDILTRPSNPNGPYGPFQVSVTGFSEVYESFGGGNGQIAIHGTNRPELIGTPASNGCVRMSNEDIAALIPLVPQGTPVLIVE